MDITRSGRKIKRSTKFRDMEDDFNDFEIGNGSGEDFDYNLDDHSSEESIDDLNMDEDVYYDMPKQSLRISNKQLSAEELTWKDGKLVPVPDSIMNMPILKPKLRLKSNVNEEIMNRIHVVKDDPSSRFYSTVIEALKKPSLNYSAITLKHEKDTEQLNHLQLDLLCDEKFNIKLETKNQSLIPKYDKSNDKINEIMGLSLDMEDLQRYSRLTGYILFTIVSKKKSENSVSDSGQSHRKIQENWTVMPERTKRDWEIKAKQVKKLIDNKRRNDVIENVSKKEKRRIALKKAEENIKKAKITDFNLSDLAFYLKTVGEGMSKMSTKIATHTGTVAVEGVESIMLDYLLCSLVALTGIFEDSEGLDKTTSTDSLNKLTFILPGLN